MLGERCEFVLGGRGHIQTIVAPPGGKKDYYFINPDKSKSPEEWLETAERVQGNLVALLRRLVQKAVWENGGRAEEAGNKASPLPGQGTGHLRARAEPPDVWRCALAALIRPIKGHFFWTP